ncbi:transposase [soil metagenome]
MPRAARLSLGGYCYHVLNRGKGRRTVFRKIGDYDAFVKAIQYAQDKLPIRILAACLMPNHFHLVLWPERDGDLSHWMQWLMTTHVRRYHEHYKSSGHIWQGRFKAFAIQEDDHLLYVLRYVERNPLKAGLCEASTAWTWSSARWRCEPSPTIQITPSTVSLPANWTRIVDTEPSDANYRVFYQCLERNRPYGTDAWTTKAAQAMGLASTLRERGRPRKTED